MGANCCVDRDKPRKSSVPADAGRNTEEKKEEKKPDDAFVTKKAKVVLKPVLLVANDQSILSSLVKQLQDAYQTTPRDGGFSLHCDEWTFELTAVISADIPRVSKSASEAKTVFFCFSLQDRKALDVAYSAVNMLKAQSRTESAKYLVGVNSQHSEEESQRASEFAADLQCVYLEIPQNKDCARILVEKMKSKP